MATGALDGFERRLLAAATGLGGVRRIMVVPRGKKLPEGGTQTTAGAGSHRSAAVRA